jgi:acetoacetyl-CoA synthetase
MMWNFLVSGLSLGCTLVLYDGSPLRDVSLLWKLVDDLGITIFGTSAKYLDQLSVRCLSIFASSSFYNCGP